METRGITEQEVWDVLANPSCGTYVPKTRRSKEFYCDNCVYRGGRTMRTPVDMKVDSEVGVAVLRYSNSSSRRSLPIGHDIVFDISEDGDLLRY
jgi:hypothetical protein